MIREQGGLIGKDGKKRLIKSTNVRINEVMKKFRTFEDLECWQACRELRVFVAKVCRGFPKEEEYRLKDQILRSARSTTANIAEGYGRRTTQQYIHALYLAYGSLCELETQLMLCHDLKYLESKKHKNLQMSLKETERMLKALIKSLEALEKSRSS